MKNSTKIVMIASMLVSGAFLAEASALPTNVVQSISIQLTGTAQGATSTNHDGSVMAAVTSQTIGTKDVIKALGGGSGAQLLQLRAISYVTNITTVTNHGSVKTNISISGSSVGNPSIIVLRENGADTVVTNLTTTEVSTVAPEAFTVSRSGTVESQTVYRIETFTFKTATLDFTIQGLEVVTLSIRHPAGIKVTDNSASLSALSGTFGAGTTGTEIGVCTGTSMTLFQVLE